MKSSKRILSSVFFLITFILFFANQAKASYIIKYRVGNCNVEVLYEPNEGDPHHGTSYVSSDCFVPGTPAVPVNYFTGAPGGIGESDPNAVSVDLSQLLDPSVVLLDQYNGFSGTAAFAERLKVIYNSQSH